MKISNFFKNIIKDTFYDKKIDVYSSIEVLGEELDTIITKGELKIQNLDCNVQNTSNDIVQREYGLTIEANIMVSCDGQDVKNTDIIIYNQVDYIVTGVLLFDSHTKIFAKVK